MHFIVKQITPPTPPTPTPNLFTWGDNAQGELGQGTPSGFESRVSSPVQVGSLDDWYKLDCGVRSVIMVKTDGTLWGVGDGNFGQLGNLDTVDRSSPVQAGSGTDWIGVSSGGSANYSIKANGTLWAWGNDGNGQQGRSTYYQHNSSPNQVGSDTDWSKVTGGSYLAFAVRTDGTLWGWGQNSYGALGLGDTTERSSPSQIGALTTWSDVAGGQYFGLAVKTDGTLWAWGDGGFGQTGLGSTVDRSSPMQVGGDTNWSKVFANGDHSFGIKTDGTLWAWGHNDGGQLGLGDSGNPTNRSSPVQVGALTNWEKVAVSSGGFTVALKTTGTLWSWGYNTTGNLGHGDLINRSSPVQVGSQSDWTDVGVGLGHTAALRG